jgi:flagellar FliL protein
MATSTPKAVPKSVPKAVQSPESSEAAPKKSKKKLWMMLIVVLVLAAGGAGGWYYWSGMKAHEQPAKEKAVPPVFVALETFTVNLQPDNGEHFLQIGVTLQVITKEEADLIKLNMPQVRSRLLLLLSSKKASEISSTEGKNSLASEIADQVNKPFSPQGAPQTVSNVFFTSLVIQ